MAAVDLNTDICGAEPIQLARVEKKKRTHRGPFRKSETQIHPRGEKG